MATQLLAADVLLERLARLIPPNVHDNIVVVGSIAAAAHFRDITGDAVATKDIDLLLRPAVDAVVAAESIGSTLLQLGWKPHYPPDVAPGTSKTPSDQLPALRLRPPEEPEGWFVELLATPNANQGQRREWHRFETQEGVFGLPSFRFMPVATHKAVCGPHGLRIATPPAMALAHLLEHTTPDSTPISSLAGRPPRFVKDVGRAIALWTLAREASAAAPIHWEQQWHSIRDALGVMYPQELMPAPALQALSDWLPEARVIAARSILVAQPPSPSAWERSYESLLEFATRYSL